ncbi:conserved Plasmodium protein, unknown function [Plasmodium berghei]|uniref:DNA2/NAM7 helicase-like C-terminal domain-containing protein n=1 Tax=Plasmodium berghei TaxID=5821 RepID=A0A1D3LXQ5_PLABE|nr:conserved Plasmodium protein, unknown function [Plasmodium berghei]
MNILNRIKWNKNYKNCFINRIIKKQHFSNRDINYEVYEGVKCFNKFEELANKKIIYKKDYKDYLKLYKLYKPNNTKLSIDKNNYFNFSLCWAINEGKTICVYNSNSDENKKIKIFTSTIKSLRQKLEQENKIDCKDEKLGKIVKYRKEILTKNKNNKNLCNDEKEKKKWKGKVNYAKLTKLWELFLYHKEKNNIKEEKTYFEILKKLFLKYEFFEKNKKNDFQFFENILTSLLLKSNIFINVLNNLYSIFFNSFLCSSSSHMIQNNTITQSANNISNNSNKTALNQFPVIINNSVRKENDITLLECVNKKKPFNEKDGNIKSMIKCSMLSGIEQEIKNEKEKIRRYILNYIFNMYYEKYIGLKNLYKSFDLQESYKLKYCSKENNLFKFICLENIDIEKKNIILIKCKNKNGHMFFLGFVKNVRKVNDFCVVYMDIKKYQNDNKNIGIIENYKEDINNLKLYEEQEICEEYFESYFNRIKDRQENSNNENLEKIKNSTLFQQNSDHEKELIIYEGITLSVQLNTITNRIKYSILNIFEKKKENEYLNNEVTKILLNDDTRVDIHTYCDNEEGIIQRQKKKNILNNSMSYTSLIHQAVNRFLESQKKHIQVYNILNEDLIKQDQIINKLYKQLKNSPQEFTKISEFYKKFDIYQKKVLKDILVDSNKPPIHIIHGAPGSGKSNLISFLIYMLSLEKKNNIFVGTCKHISVENIKRKLINLNLCLNKNDKDKAVKHQKSDIYIDTIYQAFKIKDKKIKHLIIDEASSLSEYNSLICLNLNANYIYAFGDDKQLTFHSIINEQKRNEINYFSIFEKLKQYKNVKCHYLFTQYRLIFPIYLFISFYFYNNKLIASKKIVDNFIKSNKSYFFEIFKNDKMSQNVQNNLYSHFSIPILFIDTYTEKLNHDVFEQKINQSYINSFEAMIILKLIQIISLPNLKPNLAILTPYISQKNYIQKILQEGISEYEQNDGNEKNDNHKRNEGNKQNVGNEINESNISLNIKSIPFAQAENFPDFKQSIQNEKKNLCFINSSESALYSNNRSISSNVETNIYNNTILNYSKSLSNEKSIINSNSNRLSSLFNIPNKKNNNFIHKKNEEQYNNNFYKNVYTIDSYQGCESDLIIISTVRSNENYSLGFLNDEKRMNVLLTRMKKGIIIIGNSKTLKNNFFWNEFISFLDFFNSRKSVFSLPALKDIKY